MLIIIPGVLSFTAGAAIGFLSLFFRPTLKTLIIKSCVEVCMCGGGLYILNKVDSKNAIATVMFGAVSIPFILGNSVGSYGVRYGIPFAVNSGIPTLRFFTKWIGGIVVERIYG